MIDTQIDAIQCSRILGTRIDKTCYAEAVDHIIRWAQQGQSCYVCAANVHMVMEGYDHSEFREIVNGARLTTTDGMPLVWMLRLLGHHDAQRVYGPDLTMAVLRTAEDVGIPVGFYGGRPEVLDALVQRVAERYPRLKIVYAYSPPFGDLSAEDDAAIVNDINRQGAAIVFVGLGCPKQEIWMSQHQNQVHAVMLGVGAAFDFLAGAKPQAPAWMQASALEWLFRLYTEPRRLWARYLIQNPRFVFLTSLQLVGLFRALR